MIHVCILDAQCITLLLCEFPAQFFALMPPPCSGPVSSATIGGFSTTLKSGTREAPAEVNLAELSTAAEESFPWSKIPRKTFQIPRFYPRKSFQIITHSHAAVMGGADEPLARETQQCQHLWGFKLAAQGLCGQDQAHGLGGMRAALLHLQQEDLDHRQPGAEFCLRVQWRFKPGSHTSWVPSVPKTGQNCCSPSPPCSLLGHLSSPDPAPAMLLLLSLAWGLPEACLLLVWDPVGSGSLPFPVHVKAVHSPVRNTGWVHTSQAEPGLIPLPVIIL